MAAQVVRVFFYGSYINRRVLAEVGSRSDHWQHASLAGFDISIRPLANLVRSDRHRVYGILASSSHEELKRLYRHAREVLGGTYLPEAVLVETRGGAWQPALCYLAPEMAPAPTTSEYLDRIVHPAKEYGFPDWYTERLEGFRP